MSAAAADAFPADLARRLPKAELHVHLEGTVDAETVLELARRHGVSPPAPDPDGVRAWYAFASFDQFLERYFRVLDLLRDPDDFSLVAERYLHLAHEQGVVHVELHVSATGHLVEGGKRWADVQRGIVDGCRAAAAATGISWGLIPDISPHLPVDASARAIREVLDHRDAHVVALGMGGPASHWWTQDFRPIYGAAAAEGLALVAHAGEHGPADEVRYAIEQFGVQRVQHGIGVMGDPAVVHLARERGVVFDVCPGSNLALGAVPDDRSHPLPAMLAAGLLVTLGSDDPPLFHTCLLDEYERAWQWCQLDRSGLVELAATSLRASIVEPAVVERWLRQLAAVADEA